MTTKGTIIAGFILITSYLASYHGGKSLGYAWELQKQLVTRLNTLTNTRARVLEQNTVWGISRAYGLDPILVQAVIGVESSGGRYLYRFEPGVYNRLSRVKNEQERRMLASSHGPMHVLGITAAARGVHWSELYDNTTALETGVSILARCKEQGKSNYRMLACYNTGSTKQSVAADNYYSKVMSQYKQLIKKARGV